MKDIIACHLEEMYKQDARNKDRPRKKQRTGSTSFNTDGYVIKAKTVLPKRGKSNSEVEKERWGCIDLLEEKMKMADSYTAIYLSIKEAGKVCWENSVQVSRENSVQVSSWSLCVQTAWWSIRFDCCV